MKTNKSAQIAIGVTIFSFLQIAVIFILGTSLLREYGMLFFIGKLLASLKFLVFYVFESILYEFVFIPLKVSILFYRLEEFILTPLFYGFLAYMIDRFILNRFLQKAWLRVLILLIIFVVTSIIFFNLYPPFRP